jgi:hypothetical protein
MAKETKTTGSLVEPLSSAWERDKAFGLRLDQAFPAKVGEPSAPFLLLAGKIDGEIETEIGTATHTSLVVQKLDDRGRPAGMMFKVGTLASAIAEKINAAVPDDFPAIVQTMVIPSRFEDRNDALVLQYVGETDPSALLDEFGIGGDVIAKTKRLGRQSEEG